MYFLIDANFPANSASYLRSMYRRHIFDHVVTGDYDPNMDDIPLFEVAREKGVDAFITGDIAQIQGHDRRKERESCREAGIHWLGVPQIPKARGKDKKWGQINSLLANLGYAVREFEASTKPQAILLRPGIYELQSEVSFPQDL